MADMLNVPVDTIEAVLQKCPGISDLERGGIIAMLRTHNVALPEVTLNPELTSTYILADFEDTGFRVPEPTRKNGFKLSWWSGDHLLPYELQEGITVPHLVVVTANAPDACNFFDMLMSQKGLTVLALEFLIHGHSNFSDDDLYHYNYCSASDLETIQKDLEGTALRNWAGFSQSIKILTGETCIKVELERHVRFVLDNGLRNLRGLSDQDRAFEEPQNESDDNADRRRGRRRRRRHNRDRRSRSRSHQRGADSSGTDSS